MKLNLLTDEKLQIEILEYIDSFPSTYPHDEPTRTTIYNHFVRDKKINIKIFEPNFNKLRDKYIRFNSSSPTKGEIFFLTPEGKELIVNSKHKPNKNNKISQQIQQINISGATFQNSPITQAGKNMSNKPNEKNVFKDIINFALNIFSLLKKFF